VIDLRSDLLTRPTAAVQAAMAEAAAAPTYFGLREDPYQQALERRVADLLGFEDALLFPTCSMANEVALLLLSRPGETVVTQLHAHIVTSEAGAPAALGGVLVETVPGSDAMPPLDGWIAAAGRGEDPLKSRVGLFVIENTHNRSGGRAVTAAYQASVLDVARRHGIAAHLDGARLFNAAVALDTTPAALARGFDTVAISLNKGAGAPIGAALAGSAALIKAALGLRQRLGGGIRPTGIVAAGALAALADMGHIADDHRRARRLAALLGDMAGLAVRPVETNIVVVEPSGGRPEGFCELLELHGVRALPFGPEAVRFVTYRDVDDLAIEGAAAAIRLVARQHAETVSR
jgi:threonine aldolase